MFSLSRAEKSVERHVDRHVRKVLRTVHSMYVNMTVVCDGLMVTSLVCRYTKKPVPDRKQRVSFALAVRESTIPGGGKGVFAVGDIPQDHVACLYPGLVYLNEHLTKTKIHFLNKTRDGEANSYMIARFDDVIIDGRLVCRAPLVC